MTLRELFAEQQSIEERMDTQKFIDTMNSEEVYETMPHEQTGSFGEEPPKTNPNPSPKKSKKSNDADPMLPSRKDMAQKRPLVNKETAPLLIIAFCSGILLLTALFRFAHLGFASDGGSGIVPQVIPSTSPSTKVVETPGPERTKTIRVHDTQVVVRQAPEKTKTITATATMTQTVQAPQQPQAQQQTQPGNAAPSTQPEQTVPSTQSTTAPSVVPTTQQQPSEMSQSSAVTTPAPTTAVTPPSTASSGQ